LVNTLQDYKRNVDLYTLYYGKQWFNEFRKHIG
jgi:hypothetical protein